MKVTVYKLYERGIRLERKRVFACRGHMGELEIRDRPDVPRRGILIAQLMKTDLTYVLPVLDSAVVTRITRRGMLIEGKEIIPPRGAKGYDTRYTQAWWCELEAAVEELLGS